MRFRSGYPELLVCTLTWGSLGVIRRHLDLSSGVIVFFRLALGALVVVAWLAARGRLASLRARERTGLLVAAGVILGLHWVLEFEAYARLDVAAAILIVFIGPVIAALGAPIVLGERLRAPVVAALCAAIAGISLICVPDIERIDAIGLLSALGSAVLFGVLLLVAKVATRYHEPARLVVWQLSIGALVVSPFLGRASTGSLARGAALLVLLGVVHTGALGILYFRALAALETQRFGVLAYLEPAAAVVFAWVFLAESPRASTLLGGALIVAAGAAIIATERAPVAPPDAPVPSEVR